MSITSRKPFKVIITGAASFSRYAVLSAKCRKILARKMADAQTEVVVISGCYSGAELLGMQWASENGLRVMLHTIGTGLSFADGETDRCRRMLQDADALIAFDWPPYPNRHMIRLIDGARQKGIPYRVID